MKSLAYADGLLLVVCNLNLALKNIFNLFDYYKMFSGYAINPNKTNILNTCNVTPKQLLLDLIYQIK